jgi:Na+/melibiose symporter-like transporter
MGRMRMIRDLKEFLIVRKKFWLLPIIIVLLLVAVLLFVAESSVISPFIYVLF